MVVLDGSSAIWAARPDVAWSFARALGCVAQPAVIPALAHLASHLDPDVRYQVTQGLPGCVDEDDETTSRDAMAVLIALTRDRDRKVRDWATFGLAIQMDVDGHDVRDALVARLEDEGDTADEALCGLARRHDRRALAIVRERLRRDFVGKLVFEAAGLLADPSLLDELRTWPLDDDVTAAINACDPAPAGHPSTKSRGASGGSGERGSQRRPHSDDGPGRGHGCRAPRWRVPVGRGRPDRQSTRRSHRRRGPRARGPPHTRWRPARCQLIRSPTHSAQATDPTPRTAGARRDSPRKTRPTCDIARYACRVRSRDTLELTVVADGSLVVSADELRRAGVRPGEQLRVERVTRRRVRSMPGYGKRPLGFEDHHLREIRTDMGEGLGGDLTA
jgi:hypothetical protein